LISYVHPIRLSKSVRRVFLSSTSPYLSSIYYQQLFLFSGLLQLSFKPCVLKDLNQLRIKLLPCTTLELSKSNIKTECLSIRTV